MKKLTRRTLLKLAAAGAGFALIENAWLPITGADELVKGGKSVSRTTGLVRRSVPSTCMMCPARCGILAFVEEGSLVKIEGNPRDPNSRGRLCAKGHAGLNLLYHPDRVLYPLRRKGPRGSGSWTRITWDEALDEVADRLKALRDANRAGELALVGGMLEGTGGVAGRFMRAFGSSRVIDEAALYNANKRLGLRLTWGAEADMPDLGRARYILNFGANPFESHPFFLPVAQRLVAALASGAKLVTIDPRLSGTAARSAEWLHVHPGSDATIALAMANVILQRGLYDGAFVRQWLNLPLEELARHVAQYTPKMASEASGVPEATIERIAVEFATAHPATTLAGGGLSQQTNGVTAERAVMLLNALTGNVDVSGGYCLPRSYTLGDLEPAPPAPKAACANCASLPQFFNNLRVGGEKAGVLFTNRANPVFNAPDGATIAATLKNETAIPYHVAFESFLTETAVLADIVLPAATYLESWDVHSPPAADLVPFVSLMQPAIKPLGESHSLTDTCRELAQRLGGAVAEYLSFSTDEYLDAATKGIAGLERAGGLDYLKRYGVYFDPSAIPAHRSYERTGFATPSGKLEVLVNAPGQPALPQAPAGGDASEGLTLITFRLGLHGYSHTTDSMWLSEISHDNPVWLHPERAEALGIKRGDHVTVQSEVGTIRTRAWLTQAINPDVVAIGVGVGHGEGSRIGRAQAFESEEPNTKLLWWAKKGNGVHPYPLVPLATDPSGGGPAWSAKKVRVQKAE